MSLNDCLERLNQQADEILGVLRKQTAQPVEPPVGTRSDFMPAAPFFFLAGFRAMRNSLVELPGSYYERRERDVVVACRCRRATAVPVYSFHECHCGRVFCVTPNTVRVLPLEEQAQAA